MARNDFSEGLLSKRSELTGRLEQLDRERESILADIAALDRAVQVFDPNYAPSGSPRCTGRKRPPTAVRFGRHELPTMIGQVLRSADNAMTTGDVGAAVADRKNVPADDRDTRSWLAVRLGIVLNGLERGKAVTGIRMPGERSVRWRTVP